MRLWHFALIPYLPKQMLVSQWRECIAIKRQWEKGTLKHRLVSYVMNNKKMTFYNYVELISNEMEKRNICYKHYFLDEIYIYCHSEIKNYFYREYFAEHDKRYLRQCLYNLEEKAVRGIISKKEWLKIYNKFKYDFDLWNGEK